jgi:serine/threonine protein kinase
MTGKGLAEFARELTLRWERDKAADLVDAIQTKPDLLTEKSLLLGLALQEYKIRRAQTETFDLGSHCERFSCLDATIQQSIVRQLQVQSYLEKHPELLEELSEPDWPVCGDFFGPFEVLEELGQGSLARVYLCRQREMGNRMVVVKASPVSQNEALILGRMNHPHIMPVYSVGSVEERSLHFLCMPFCGRSTLVELVSCAFQESHDRSAKCLSDASNIWIKASDEFAISRSPPTMSRLSRPTYVDVVLQIAIQIAEALSHAHSNKIVHGDVKPSNVLLTPAGDTLLLDFNLSQDLVQCLGLPGGTLPYMAPEQLHALAGHRTDNDLNATVQSDIYGFGILLHELVVGKLPFTPTGAATEPADIAADLLSQFQQREQCSWENRSLSLSQSLWRLIHQCLEFDVANRPQSMSLIAASLRRELRSTAVLSRSLRSLPRHYVVAGCISSALLVGGGLLVAFRPPPHIAAHRAGVTSLSKGDWNTAIQSFEAALSEQPSFPAAKFDLAKAKLHAGNVDDAISGFTELARINSHDYFASSMAYLGYCFNVKQIPAAPIPWYEKALNASAFQPQLECAIRNNLGVSYLSASGGLSEKEQIRMVETQLLAAQELCPHQPIVKLNLVQAELKTSRLKEIRLPASAAETIEAVCGSLPDSSAAWLVAARVFGRLSETRPNLADRGLDALAKSIELGGITTEEDLISDPDLESLRLHAGFSNVLDTYRRRGAADSSSELQFYIEPVGP